MKKRLHILLRPLIVLPALFVLVSTAAIGATVTNVDGMLRFTPASPVTITLRGKAFVSTGSDTIEFGGTGLITISGAQTTLTNILISITNVSGIVPAGGWTVGCDLTIDNGSVFNGGSVLSHTITLVNDGTIQIANIFTINATASLINTNNRFEYNGSSAQTVTPFTYCNLTLSGGGTKTIDADQQVNGNVIQQSGTALHAANTVIDWQIDGALTTDQNFVNDGIVAIGN